MDTIGAFSAASCRRHDNECRRVAMLRGIHRSREIDEASRGPVDDALIACQLDLERGPAVWCVDYRVNLFAAVRLSPGIDRTAERLGIDTKVAYGHRFKMEFGGGQAGEKIHRSDLQRGGAQGHAATT